LLASETVVGEDSSGASDKVVDICPYVDVLCACGLSGMCLAPLFSSEIVMDLIGKSMEDSKSTVYEI